jgi:hypothetical protein
MPEFLERERTPENYWRSVILSIGDGSKSPFLYP